MSFEKVEQILTKSREVLKKLEANPDELDALQKAQVVQSLIRAKEAMHTELKLQLSQTGEENSPNPELMKTITQFEHDLQKHIVEVDVPKVATALEHLGEGVEELLKRKESGEKILEE